MRDERRKPRPFEGLIRVVRLLSDDEACADLDREVAARVNSGEVAPLPRVEPPRGADLSSIEWLWAEPQPESPIGSLPRRRCSPPGS